MDPEELLQNKGRWETGRVPNFASELQRFACNGLGTEFPAFEFLFFFSLEVVLYDFFEVGRVELGTVVHRGHQAVVLELQIVSELIRVPK